MRIKNVVNSVLLRRAKLLSQPDTQALYDDVTESGAKDIDDFPNFRSDSNESIEVESVERKSSCPSLTTIILLLALLAVFIVLPIIYLLSCFNLIYERRLDEVHYQPSKKIHDLLNAFHTESTKSNGLPIPPKPDYNQCKLVTKAERFDCLSTESPNQRDCEARGCCWIPVHHVHLKKPPLDTPDCFYPPNYNTYRYVNITETNYGLVAFLKRNYSSTYPNDVELLKMIVKYETESRLHIKLIDPNFPRYEPPYPEVPIVNGAALNPSYIFEIDSLKPGFKVLRKEDKTIIFDSNNFQNLIYSNQFIQISSKLPSKYIYGLGEHRSTFLLSTDWSLFTLFNHDAIPQFNKNGYGSHPFYLLLENSSKSHGVFLLNSNAMDIILQPAPAITFRTIGGVLDFYFFMGPTPSDVVSQYTELVRRPFMPPYWALGFHLCRFGYNSLNDTKKVMERNIKAGIPLDTQWNDLDYMDNHNDFTYDKSKFGGLPKFVKDLHNRGMHYIPLMDPGISASEIPNTYPPYDTGIKMDIFVKNSSGQPFIGKVWNSKSTVWPDFTHPNTVNYWTQMLRNLHGQIEFDGLWIDMNEPSNFLSGCPRSSLETPPYLPGVDGGALNYKTMCMSAQHYAGLHYNVHNLFGFTEGVISSFAMAEIRGKRPMVISRSTFSGQGHYTGHWSGDVWSAWADMRYTIPELLSFSLFGVPLMGADICGFNGNTTASLCNRWMQLGAFYPFSRNHNTDDGIDQDPVAMGNLVVSSSKNALRIRYSLLPYLYTLFFKAYKYGETVSRPLFFEFTDDPKTYAIDTQFLWGPALMIIPVLQENHIFVNAYLPKGVWYDFYSRSEIISAGTMFNLSAPLDEIPLMIRGGHILPMQAPMSTTTLSRMTKMQLLVASDANGLSLGQLYWDDGDSLNSYEEKRYSLISFALQGNTLRSNINFIGIEVPPNLGKIIVLGVRIPVKQVTVNGVTTTPFKYDTINRVLTVDRLNVPLNKPFAVAWK
ncbi:unnamed protein product [Acanthoscelides obtectus]|uniref:P-type domain-containing protein n=1 Tax=Acanthoscelides obtectus TaxID=200917 RepID=A0A9P0M9N0_ACAOB|nr:unnamed protein product [Acanthoscelides obtectus]CAK1675497.1 Lysosomal alpha-glucosidase [Acanthoscelides obtectus]